MRRILVLIAVLVIPPIGAAMLDAQSRMPNRFAEVEAGRLYRGGYPSGEHLQSLASRYDIKTVVNLTDARKKGGEAASDIAGEEADAARRLGMKMLVFPMPGNGQAPFNMLDDAADAMADSQNGPTYFHCAAGKMRSGAALAAYRMKHCGWSYGRAMAEAEQYDLTEDSENDVQLRQHLRKYAMYLRDRHGIATAIEASGLPGEANGSSEPHSLK